MELALNCISKTYKKGSVKALDNFSVTLTPGVYGLLGPNGAGKSTLMNIITDNLNADSGDVLYDGENIKKLGTSAFSVTILLISSSFFVSKQSRSDSNLSSINSVSIRCCNL